MKPTIPEILPRVQHYIAQPGNEAGGALHIVLDGNVEDSHVTFCLKCAEEWGDTEGAEIARCLLQMSKTQRRVIVRRL